MSKSRKVEMTSGLICAKSASPLLKVPVVEKRVRASTSATGPARSEVWGRIIARRLRNDLSAEVEVVITDNTRTMVAFHRERDVYSLRLHHMFLGADEEVLTGLGRFLRGEKTGTEMMDQFIEDHRHLIRAVSPGARRRRARIRPRGAHHDLGEVFDRLNRRYFDGRVQATITWAIVPRLGRRRKSIKLGSYSEDSRIIRIHPALDHPAVPPYFVEWIVFHEILHAVEGADSGGARRVVHTDSFKGRELEFRELRRASKWERDHIEWLLAWQPKENGCLENRCLGARVRPR